MNTANSNNAINPVDMITKLAETQITEAIVTAAKSKKTVEKTFSEEILENLAAGRYAEEAAINLTRIFGREFDPIADQILQFAKRLTPSDAPVAPAKKPRAKKASKTLAPSADAAADGNMVNEGLTETTNETKKTKKPRAKKVTVKPVAEPTSSNDVIAPVDAVASSEPVDEPAPAAAPAKKPRAKKTVSVDTTNEKKEEPGAVASDSSVTVSELPVEKPAAAKKPRAKKTVSVGTTSEKEEIVTVASVESVTVSEVPVEKSVSTAAAPPAAAPAKKPRAKKTVSVDTTNEKKEEPVAAAAASDDSSVNAVSEKPVKKPRIKKVVVVAPAPDTIEVDVSPPATVSETFKPIAEVQNEVAVEEVITSSAEHNDIILTDEDFDAELSGFSEGWTDELIEEELSDIEYDDE